MEPQRENVYQHPRKEERTGEDKERSQDKDQHLGRVVMATTHRGGRTGTHTQDRANPNAQVLDLPSGHDLRDLGETRLRSNNQHEPMMKNCVLEEKELNEKRRREARDGCTS